MSDALWWKLLAIVGTILNGCWAIAIVIPAESFRYFATCTLHVTSSLQGLMIVGAFTLALPVTATFATAAARNSALPLSQRIPWAVALVIASPLAIPYYWWLFLRDVGARE